MFNAKVVVKFVKLAMVLSIMIVYLVIRQLKIESYKLISAYATLVIINSIELVILVTLHAKIVQMVQSILAKVVFYQILEV